MPAKDWRAPLADRFWSKIEVDANGCWIWTANQHYKGYGLFVLEGKTRKAHRVAYELFFGPIAEGLTIDHLCRKPPCVNPMHLEAVTNLENTLRGNNFIAGHARKTHCKNGHEFTSENTHLYTREGAQNATRVCLACKRARRKVIA